MNESLKSDMINVVEEYSSDEDMCLWYDKEQNDKAIFNGSIDLALEQGEKKGLEQGYKDGIMKEKSEIAKQMLKKDMNINLISELTSLSIDEINSISL